MEKNCGCHEEALACVECGTPVLERVNYYDGQFLVARDLSDEQRFLLGKHREHLHRMHAWGTVCGLKVTPHPDPACQDRFVVIEPGLAVDCCGREIHVTSKVYVDLRAELSAADALGPDDKVLLLSICYDECRTEYAPALYSDCACDEDRCEPSRIKESFQVKLQMAKDVPQPPKPDLSGVRLDRTGTLNFSNAVRIALDDNLGRIYLLNNADPSQIAVYDSATGCLMGSIAVGAHALDLAPSPDGKTLYLVIHTTGPDANKLRALDVDDLSAVTQIGADLAAGDGAIDPAKPPRVVCSSTRVFVLNAVAKKVFVFDTSPALAAFATFDKGEDCRDIAVTPDGTWLFVASPAHIWAAKVATLKTSPALTVIGVADDPLLVAVSGDGARVYTAAAVKTVHAFRIQETPVPFPEIGTGVSVTDPVVSIAASAAGEWLFVLGNAAGKGVIRPVDADRFETSPTTAVGDPVPVGDGPVEIALDPDGTELYAVYAGSVTSPCSGAAILHLTEQDCQEILWQALDGCPDCVDPSCLILAVVRDFSLGQSVTGARIDNRVRRLAPSTESLRRLIECCCSSHSDGQKGPRGDKGDPGDAATIAVGTVTTGTPAKVVNSGTASAAVFDFTIPQGAQGDPGTAATVKVGAVTTGTPANVVNSGTPSAAVLDFTLPKGDKGDAGTAATITVGAVTSGTPAKVVNSGTPSGAVFDFTLPKGDKGDAGTAATITVGTVTTGTPANVVNVGTPSAAKLNFTIPKGDKGDQGDPGVCDCCETGLTHIVRLSWTHDKLGSLATVSDPNIPSVGDRKAVIVQFDHDIAVPDGVAGRQVFRVEMLDQTTSAFRCYCELQGEVIPVTSLNPANGVITSAKRFLGSPPANADALAFLLTPQTEGQVDPLKTPSAVRVTLLGDLILDADAKNPRAIDAEFVRAQLPTGDRPAGSTEGIQGGTFYSWFWNLRRA